MSRFFSVMLVIAAVASLTAVTGHVITPLIAGRGIGARAAMRAVRDEEAQGRHAKDDTDARVYDFGSYQQ
jgi:hypothetical protein